MSQREQRRKAPSILSIVRRIAMASTLLSVAFAAILISVWGIWTHRQHLAETDTKLRAQIDLYAADLATSYTLHNFDGLEFQLAHILKDAPLDCAVLWSPGRSTLRVVNHNCPKDMDNLKAISVQSGGLNIGEIRYRVSTLGFQGKQLLEVALLFVLIAALLSVIWFFMLRRIVKTIVNPIKKMAQSLEDGSDDRPEQSCREIDYLAEKVRQYNREQRNAIQLRAMVQTVQMLAHDMRKPFSMLESVVSVLESASDPDEVSRLASRFGPEVKKACADANALIQDVLEAGSITRVEMMPVEPASLIESTLEDMQRLHKGAAVPIRYSFLARTQVMADRQRTGRVFANLVSNALQAMEGAREARLWFRVEDHVSAGKTRLIRFTIGNAGSYIPEEDREKLFDAFYTRGKRDGTGLGLAIARKIINAHGGSIWCDSHPVNGTEFSFTLPAAIAIPSLGDLGLPERFPVLEAPTAAKTMAPEQAQLAEDTSDLIRDVMKHLTKQHGALRVLLVDDEDLYLSGLERMILGIEELKGRIEVKAETRPEQALLALRTFAPDLVICDIDFGPDSLNGYDVVRALRGAGFTGPVCMHSNRTATRDLERSVAVGANAFFPKPMTRAHFLKFLLEHLESRSAPRSDALPEIAVVDDNVFVGQVWKAALGSGAKTHIYPSPEAFWRAATQDPGLLDRLACVVTDLIFDNSDKDGIDFAKDLRSRTKAPVFLSSNADVNQDEKAAFDGVIGKRPLPLEALLGRASPLPQGIEAPVEPVH